MYRKQLNYSGKQLNSSNSLVYRFSIDPALVEGSGRQIQLLTIIDSFANIDTIWTLLTLLANIDTSLV